MLSSLLLPNTVNAMTRRRRVIRGLLQPIRDLLLWVLFVSFLTSIGL
ncbi:hypothetical protein NC651_000011 [Populus alba x Populus x berolinensis]|nr:hypothetical protein NC651_000011 [Populus alba x Populus x berolinensis]